MDIYGLRVKVSNNIYHLYNEEMGMISGTLGVYILAKVPDHEHEVCIFYKGWDFNNFIVSIHQCEEITSYSKHPNQRVIDFTIYVELAY